MILALLAVGIVSFTRLNLDSFPEVNIPYVLVSVALPGASPDQVEAKVTEKIEDAVGEIAGVKHVTSSVSEGFTYVFIEFNDTKSVDDCSQDVRTKINSIIGTLPSDITDPVIQTFDMNAMPILSLTVSGDLSTTEMTSLVNDKILPGLNTVEGVGNVTTYGLQEREIKIKLDKNKLATYRLTTYQVISALQSDNFDYPSGKVGDSSREVTLRTYSSIRNANDFNNIVITTLNGTQIRVSDVAEVVDDYKDRSSVSYYNGKECIGVNVVKQSGTNTVVVADNIKKEIVKLQAAMPDGVKIETVRDDSDYIRESVASVEKSLFEGCILAILIIFLFLRGVGSTLTSAISLPTSIITTFAAMKLMNFSLNIISLMGLSLSIGLLIDDAIVVIENIVRHLHMGKTPLQAAKDGTKEISLAVLATTLTIVAVFLPMAVMSGIMGAYFKQFGLTIACAVMVSLFVSFTLVPLLSSRYVKEEEISKKSKIGRFLAWFNLQFDILAAYYRKVLAVVIGHRKKTILITIAIFFMSLFLIPSMGMNFVPSTDDGNITISAALDSGLSMEIATTKAEEMEAIVEKYPDVTSIYTTVNQNSISLAVKLTGKQDRNESSNQIASKMRVELKDISGLDLSVAGSTSMGGDTSSKGYSLYIQGDDFDQLLDYSQKAKQLLAEIPGAVDIGISYKAGKPETKVVVDREAANDLGVSPVSISGTLSTLFSGTKVGEYEDGSERIDVKVILADEGREDLDSLDGIYVTSSTTGKLISLDQLSEKVYATSSSSIDRYDKGRTIRVECNLVGLTSGQLNTIFMQKLNTELPMPDGIYFSQGSEQEMMSESFYALLQTIILGVLFIFFVLAAQFESFLDPLAIMVSLPLAIIGALLALFITGSGFSMIGMIGIIFLLGLVTKNAILLVDFIKQRRSQGMDRKEAILEAGLIRLRPILMTTLAMIFGMIPTALSFGNGSELRQPMAVAIIGGLISSTILTLLVIPVVYTIFDDIGNKLKRKPKQTTNVDNQTIDQVS